MTFETFVNLERNCKRDEFSYDIFDVSIFYYGGMFRIELYGGWNYDEQVPEYVFGTGFCSGIYYPGGFCSGIYYPGFDAALQVALNDIRNSNDDHRIKDMAESALARACVEFQLKHRGML